MLAILIQGIIGFTLLIGGMYWLAKKCNVSFWNWFSFKDFVVTEENFDERIFNEGGITEKEVDDLYVVSKKLYKAAESIEDKYTKEKVKLHAKAVHKIAADILDRSH